MNHLPYQILGKPVSGGLLIIGDHASNHVPEDVDLGIGTEQLDRHIALDIGVAEVAARMVERAGAAAILGNVSRLVVDFNRDPDEAAAIPLRSDGLEIMGNVLDEAARNARLDLYHRVYHDRIAQILRTARPALILSLHSFTAQLETQPEEKRPWKIGVLYNRAESASKAALSYLGTTGLRVGDQQPYSGKLLNATMNRHAEANGIDYVGIEMRQDMVREPAGQERFARILTEMCHFVSESLGLGLCRP
jgi:predicted N-formylglutamate amidohydrolase